MARRFITFNLLICLATAGCEATRQATMPAPNFAGPVVTAAPVGAAPAVVQKINPPTLPKQIANIPSNWLPLASADKRRWDYIVIHHSGGSTGSAAAFDKYHREVRKWDELGYHFVIGNGSGSADGQIEVGSRWPKQKYGAHAKTPDNQYNEHGIGICLVGNFDNTRPTARQMQSLTRLVTYLSDTYRVPQRSIIGHKMTGKQTECPGRYLDIAAVRASVLRQRINITQINAASDKPAYAATNTIAPAAGELMLSALR
jgi:N-acetyl-anhydromuramyl-L-alanine amidase AmpD